MEQNPFDRIRPLMRTDQLVYVPARRGAGKTTFVMRYIANYQKVNPNNITLFISRFVDVIERVDGIVYTTLEILVRDRIDLSDIHDALVVFDDIEKLSLNNAERQYLKGFLDDLIENSRHNNVNLLVTSHMFSNFRETRKILSEMSAIVLFPHHASVTQLRRSLKYYYEIPPAIMRDYIVDPHPNMRWVYIQLVGDKFAVDDLGRYTEFQ